MKNLMKIGATLALAVGAALAGLVWWLASGAPRTEGTLRLAGVRAPVTVGRDENGIPRIVADSAADAYFALGFVHAQDRMWQMEMQRRLGAGRLAEILGDKALPTDRFMRVLGLYRLAGESFRHLDPEVQDSLKAYAAGVNACLAACQGPIAPEYWLAGFRPEPWTPADSLVWARLMALQLAGNWRDELLRAHLLEVLPAEQVADLWPGYPAGQPVTLGLASQLFGPLLAAIPEAAMPKLASNVWVLSGDRSQTGKPILANDPHLGFQAPVLWYLVSVQAPDLQLGGGTVPGNPFVLLGHNRRIAWGITTTHSDTMDLFVEQPAGDGYLTPAGPAPFLLREEVIKVRGAADQRLTVRATRHGPVISDILGEQAGGRILALASAGLEPDDRTAQALYRLNRAGDWTAFQEALRDFHAPQQNIAYADVDGHIGLTVPGRVPLRKAGDGTLPRPGWTGEFDWEGWIPFDALPRSLDPPSGIIVNANNKVVGESYPHLLTAYWPEGYRAERIQEVLDSQPRHSPEDMAALQMDELSLMAVDLLPPMLRAAPGGAPWGARAKLALDLLRGWDYRADRRRPEPLIFEAWLRRFQRNILSTWLGPQAEAFPQLHPRFLKAVLAGRTVWCGRPGQAVPNSCDESLGLALDQALDALTGRFGEEMSQWRWGEAHHAVFPALLFRYIPGLDRLTELSVETGGDDFTVQRGSFADPTDLFRNGHGAGMRAVYDLADLDGSRFVIATGQSGNPLSRHWSDLLELWSRGGSIPLPPRRPLVRVLEILPPER